jgi:hypothetical protein
MRGVMAFSGLALAVFGTITHAGPFIGTVSLVLACSSLWWSYRALRSPR